MMNLKFKLLKMISIIYKAIRKGFSLIRNLAYTPYNKLLFYLNGISFGKSLKVRGVINVHVTRRGKVSLGEKVRINSGSHHNVIGRQQTTIFWVEGNLKIGNHVKIHNNVTLCVKGEAFINDTCWIGQDSYIDATGELIINRFSVIGIGSTICTHVRGGDILSGCKYDSDGKCVIGEDVWLMTRTLVGPYSIGNKTISLMLSANISISFKK